MRRFAPLAILVLAHLSSVSTTRAEPIHGFAWINDYYGSIYEAWHRSGVDFDTQQVKWWVTTDHAGSDLGVMGTIGPVGGDIHFWPLSGATGMHLPGVTFESLSEAPEPPYCCLNVVPEVDQTYVLLTTDGHYVKFTPRQRVSTPQTEVAAYIEYIIQTDGTREFGPLLPVAPTSWGRVKALYR